MPCCTTAHSPALSTHERVQVDLEAIGDAVVVYLRGEAAGRTSSSPFRPRASAMRGVRWRAARLFLAPRRLDAEFAEARGLRPRLRAPMTEVVIPEECQSIPITLPKA